MSFSRTAAGECQSICRSVRNPRLNHERNKCARSRSMPDRSGCSFSVSRTFRRRSMSAPVARGATFSLRKSSDEATRRPPAGRQCRFARLRPVCVDRSSPGTSGEGFDGKSKRLQGLALQSRSTSRCRRPDVCPTPPHARTGARNMSIVFHVLVAVVPVMLLARLAMMTGRQKWETRRVHQEPE